MKQKYKRQKIEKKEKYERKDKQRRKKNEKLIDKEERKIFIDKEIEKKEKMRLRNLEERERV